MYSSDCVSSNSVYPSDCVSSNSVYQSDCVSMNNSSQSGNVYSSILNNGCENLGSSGINTSDASIGICDQTVNFDFVNLVEEGMLGESRVCFDVYGNVGWNDVDVAASYAALMAYPANVTEKFDSACSRSMSGVPGRIQEVDVDPNVVIVGFNDTVSNVTTVGINGDNKTEYYVNGMPKDLALLCANDYVETGVAVLFHGDGLVLNMSAQDIQRLRDYLRKYEVIKKLIVRNRTYEVDSELRETSYASTNYFNTNVNVNTKEERVLTYLLTGLNLRDIQAGIRNNSITGFHPDMTHQQLSNFEAKWGRSPDAVQMAYPNKLGNVKGYMTKPHVYTRIGERVEMDFMECDFNEESIESDGTSVMRKKVKKLATFGGAIAAWVAYDVFSGFVTGKLVTSVAKAWMCVKDLVEYYERHGHTISVLAADRGILTEGKFRVHTSETIAYCNSKNIRTQGAEPGNHSNGTPHIERVFQVVHNMIRTGTHYILQNPNFSLLGFTKREILMSWGELFYWSMAVIPMKDSPKNPGKSRYELFHGRVPNIQDIRLLPIFSVLTVYRYDPTKASLDGANRGFYQHGLYVGPDTLVTGGIRVAIKVGNTVQIVVSTKYKCVTDGGAINIYPAVQRGLRGLLEGTVVGAEDTPVVPAATVSDLSHVPAPRVVSDVGVERGLVGGASVVDDVVATGALDASMPHVIESIVESVVANKNKNKNAKRNAARSSARVKKALNRSAWPSREERARKRLEEVALYCIPVPKCSYKSAPDIVTACYAHWSTHEERDLYYSVLENAFYSVLVNTAASNPACVEEGFKAVTVGVPKNYTAALVDPSWGDAARAEWDTLVDTKALLLVDTSVARDAIKNGSDLVVLFPVYEEKEKEGKLVRKVRLVGDGRTHLNAGNTYSPTPSREELLVILHMVAMFDWELVHIDEKRAFLNATHKGDKPVYTKLKGDSRYYLILKALYGLKTSPRDYNKEVAEKLIGFGFKPLHVSMQLFVLHDEIDGGLVLVYDFVDDFVITGNSKAGIERFIARFRSVTSTTDPVYNPTKLLGMELERDRSRRIIKVYMQSKIEELASMHGLNNDESIKHVPIPKSGYIIDDSEFEEGSMYNKYAAYLDKKGITKYMQIVGSFIWLTGVRIDIVFATTFLAWFTRQPRIHHLNMALHVVSYLYHTKHVPLVLGGKSKLGVLTDSDASLATATKRRSVLGQVTRLGDRAGAITAKAVSSTLVHCSSFEAELDACSKAIKTMLYISNVIREIGLEQATPVLHCDNEAMVNFVKGEGVAKGVRHMEIRMWYTREQYRISNVDLQWKSGTVLSADKLTKLADKNDQYEFMYDVQGLWLLE